MFEKRVFGPFHHRVERSFARADLEFYSINHFRPSYAARVFFNDDDVDEDNCEENRDSYAGRFSVFGHPQCAGDDDHCEAPKSHRRFDDRPSHPLTRAFRRVIITDSLRRAVQEGDEVTITVISATSAEADEIKGDQLLDFEGLRLVTFD